MQAPGKDDRVLVLKDKNGRKVLSNKTNNTTEMTANLSPKHAESLSDVDSVLSSKESYFAVPKLMVTSTPIFQSRIASFNFSCPNDVSIDPNGKWSSNLISDSGYNSTNDDLFKTPAPRDERSTNTSSFNSTERLQYSTPDYRDRSVVRTSSTNCTSQELDFSLDTHDKNGGLNFFPCLQSTPSDVIGTTQFSQNFNSTDEAIENWQRQISFVHEENSAASHDRLEPKEPSTAHESKELSATHEYKEPFASHSSLVLSQSIIKFSHLPELDSFHERVSYVSSSFSQEKVNSLIGKKMGLEQFDIIEGLLLKGHKHLTSCILGHLADEDLTSVMKVSKSWKAVVDGDLTARRRWRSHISNMKIQYSMSKENMVKTNRLHQSLPIYFNRCPSDSRYALQTIQTTTAITNTKRTSDIYDIFFSEARKICSHESLTKCPLCSGPARVSDLNASCTSERCSYRFCSKCRKPSHGVSLCEEALRDVPFHRRPQNVSIVGSQESRRRLKRL